MEDSGCVWNNSSLNSIYQSFGEAKIIKFPPSATLRPSHLLRWQWMWVAHFQFVHLLPVNHKFLTFREVFSFLFTSFGLCHLKARALLWKQKHAWKIREIYRETKLWVMWGKTIFSQRNLGSNMLFNLLVCDLDKWFKPPELWLP